MKKSDTGKLSLAVLALAGCATTKDVPGQPHERSDFGLPPVRAALEFPSGEREVTLGWLVDELARLSGQELAMRPQLRQQLDQLREPLELTTPVPAHEVYAYVEGMLAVQGVVVAPVKAGDRPVLGVYGSSMIMGRPEAGETRPLVIEPGQVEALVDHPALLCQVMLVFENIDSRQLQTQLRQLLVDSTGTKQVVPAGDRALLVQAPGAQLLGLVRLLRAVDLASAQRPRAAPQPAVGPAIPDGPRPGG
jgi:hypothetical protein